MTEKKYEIHFRSGRKHFINQEHFDIIHGRILEGCDNFQFFDKDNVCHLCINLRAISLTKIMYVIFA